MITKQPDSLKKALVNAVKEQAYQYYNKYPAWSYVVECLSDAEIADLIGDKVTTVKGAVTQVYAKYVKGIAIQARECAA